MTRSFINGQARLVGYYYAQGRNDVGDRKYLPMDFASLWEKVIMSGSVDVPMNVTPTDVWNDDVYNALFGS